MLNMVRNSVVNLSLGIYTRNTMPYLRQCEIIFTPKK